MNKEKQSFGPYTEDEVRIPGKAILGRPEGDFKVKMIGQTKSGVVVEKFQLDIDSSQK
jgi:hypothetical protein